GRPGCAHGKRHCLAKRERALSRPHPWRADLGRVRRRAPCADAGALEQLSRIHQSARIQSLLERAHELELEEVLVAADFVALELPQAMLGRDRAAAAPPR